MSENMKVRDDIRAEQIQLAYDRYLRKGIVMNALLNDENPIAGFLLHEEFETKLIDAVNSLSVLRSLCTSVKTTGDRCLPIVNGHGQPVWVPDGGSVPIVKDSFDCVVLDAHMLAAVIRVTNELLKESAIDIERYLAESFAERMAPVEEAAFIAGDGIDKPRGLTHQVQTGCETTAAGTVTIEDVLKLIFSVPEKYRRNGVLLMNENTLLDLYKLCAAQGHSLWFGKVNDGRDDTFFGYRITRCNAMPDTQRGNTPILFGDFKRIYQ